MSQSDTTETMSAQNQSSRNDDDRPRRHTAVRVFADEFFDAEYVFKESDSEMAPNYTLLPTGKRVNRVLVVGTLTDVEEYETDAGTFVNAQIHDGDNYFFVSASQQYQTSAANTLRDLDTPSYVAIVGKPNHYESNEGEHRIEITPEIVSQVTADDRARWVLETAEQTRDRINASNAVTDEEIEAGTAPVDVKMAREEYDIAPSNYFANIRTNLTQMFGDGDMEPDADPESDSE